MKIARCANDECVAIYLMSLNEDETYRAFCPLCRAAIMEAVFEAISEQPEDAGHKTDA